MSDNTPNPEQVARKVAQLRKHADAAAGDGTFQITADAARDIAEGIEALAAERDRLREALTRIKARVLKHSSTEAHDVYVEASVALAAMEARDD